MEQLKKFLARKTALLLRRFFLVLLLASLLGGSFPFPANAAVPIWVVGFDAGTDFEISLERFIFDLFNTLQRRQEDFTASFELQKIEKAREDVNKLFQETQEELQNFGLALDVRDPRMPGLSGNADCDAADNNPGCKPTISPLKDSRIIHDPYQYLFGDARLKAQAFTYCFFNYLIWDQRGLLPDQYPFLGGIEGFDDPKATYDPLGGKNDNSEAVERSVKLLTYIRNSMIVELHRGHYYLLNYPLQDVYGDINDLTNVEPRCRQVMNIVSGESPVTIERDLALWKSLGDQSGLDLSDEAVAAFRRHLWFLPTLGRNIANRQPGDGWVWAEFNASKEQKNSISGIMDLAHAWTEEIITETETEREATYIAGQGVRPENFYQTLTNKETGARLEVNTEYVISPAVVLLQKMQAATQATFDLAGQGFLYLDAEDTPQKDLGAYNVISTRGDVEERKICNDAGLCLLLDPWLKPGASFRSVETLDDNPTPQIIGPEGSIAGSGLPAPWEDEGSYLNIGNEKAALQRRYTIARFLNGNGGTDEIDGGGPQQDQIGGPRIGVDYPANDWYDRVIEMYEPGIGVSGNGSIRGRRSRDFDLLDWQCYIATWFFEQNFFAVSAPKLSEAYYVGTDVSGDLFPQYCQ